MQWSELTQKLGQIELVSLRNEKTRILSELLKQASAEEVGKLVYLVIGTLRPAYDRLEFNLAEKMIVRAIALALHNTGEWVTQQYKARGDLGELVEELPGVEELSVRDVYLTLEKIAQDGGSGSQERKVVGLAKLIKAAGGRGGKYIVRMVAGKLRLGFSEQTVLDAISYMVTGDKSYSAKLEQAYQLRPDVGYMAEQVKQVGVEQAIAGTTLTIGVPVIPALAQRLRSADEMIEKMGIVYVEPKYDGTRVQIHFRRAGFGVKETGGLFAPEPATLVKTFTRNLDESSNQFPELATIADHLKAEDVVLDAEAVGYDSKTGKLVPFQLTITRKRKHAVEAAQQAVPLKFFVFDIMYKDGTSLLQLPLSERRKILRETVREGGVLEVDEFVETDQPEVLRVYHQEQLAKGLEGVLVKQKSGVYSPGRSGFNWVKFKEVEGTTGKLADTIDAVVMGYYVGRGKRQQFGWGALLLGVRDTEGGIVTVGKLGTGIKDEQFRELYNKLTTEQTKVKNARYEVEKNLEPDMWVEPKLVVEVAADEITRSPNHTAGYALRFPRLVRVREDKSVNEVTTTNELTQLVEI